MHIHMERNVNFMDKDFVNDINSNLKLNFISKGINVIQSKEVPKGYKLNPKYVETKSKRVQLLIRPSTHGKLKNIAISNNISVNELINNILESYVNNSY